MRLPILVARKKKLKMRKRLPKISIVIPSFNKAKYIKATLQSIVNQNYPNLEVIIQDPGSSDGTLAIIAAYVKRFPTIFRLYIEKDDGQRDALNRGLMKSHSDIVTYINADDLYLPGALSTVGKYFLANPNTLWLVGGGCVIDKEGLEITKFITWYKNILLKLNVYNLLLITNYLMQPSVFLAKKTWKKYGPFKGETKFVMEYALWLKIGRDSMPAILPQQLSAFRIPERSISKDNFSETLAEDRRIVNTFTKNPLILALHALHNFGRRLVVKNL